MTPLLELLADGQFHTGPQLAEALGVSRQRSIYRFKRLAAGDGN